MKQRRSGLTTTSSSDTRPIDVGIVRSSKTSHWTMAGYGAATAANLQDSG